MLAQLATEKHKQKFVLGNVINVKEINIVITFCHAVIVFYKKMFNPNTNEMSAHC